MPSELPVLPGITLHGVDRRTDDELVCAGTFVEDGAAVRVRLHRATYPSLRQLARRRHAMEVGRALGELGGVVRHRMLVPAAHDLALVTDAPGLDELDRWMAATPGPGLDARLQVATSLAEALAQIHDRGVTHNALTPQLIAVDTDLRCCIGGFDRAMSLRSEAAGATDHGVSLLFASPEQTGRMNRPVDQRSDLYVLGLILFELFSGRPPFSHSDQLSLLHAHVARPAPRLSDLATDVPEALSDLVDLLLQKEPELRYQTAAGVAHDLALIARSEGADGRVRLRSRDRSERLVLRDHLYGREGELDALGSALAEASSGRRSAVFVAGYSGIGKSRLVHELEPLVVERFGWFAEGKFDLYRRDLPYAGWVGVLQAIVRQGLGLPESELREMQAELESTLGAGAAALVALCPDLTELLGAQPEVAPMSPPEARAQLSLAISGLFRGVAKPTRPLVVFLDDLQWADLASLSLLEVLLTDPVPVPLLVLGAWRENEITPDHPVRSLLRKLDDAEVAAPVLQLPPLDRTHIERIVAETLGEDDEQSRALGRVTHDKTGGNPFFVRQFLEALHRDGGLAYDRASGTWVWSPQAVAARSITDNVADLLSSRLHTLSPSALQSLQAASVIGSRFSLSTIGRLTGDDAASTARALDEALTEQLVTPLDDQYRYILHESELVGAGSPTLDPRYEFLHDRVRQAALDTLDEAQRCAYHRGQAILLADTGGDDERETLVDLASHLCEAKPLLVDAGERLAAAATLLRASQRAKATMAVDTARRFLTAAIELLPSDAWTTQYALTLALHTEAADVAYIDGRYDDVAATASVVMEYAAARLDRVPIHNILIGVGVARADYAEATEYALDVLRSDFGIHMPTHPTMAHVALELGRCRAAIGRRSTDQLLALPPMDDQEAIAVMGILMKTATNAYWAEPNLVPIIAARMIRLSLVRGNHSLSAYGYALYGMVTGGVLGAESTGYRFGKLAIELLDLRPDRSLTGRTALLWHGFIRHSRDPLRGCVSDLFDSYHAALDAGDVENACYCATVGFYAEVLAGRPLDGIAERYDGYAQSVLASGQAQTRQALLAWMQAVELLRDPETRSGVMRGELLDWPARRSELQGAGDGTALPTEAAAAAVFAFVLDDLDEAECNLELVWEYRAGAPGQVYLGPCFALYAAVIQRRRGLGDRRDGDRARLALVMRHVQGRSRRNPHDMEAYRLLVDAEAHRAAARRADAVATYLDVATLAGARGLLHVQALALDEAGALEAEAGHLDQAAHLAGAAADVWRRLGVPSRATARVGHGATVDRVDAQPAADALDQQTLFESVQIITREIEVAGLVERVLSLAMQNAGATHGLLLLVSPGGVEPVADGCVDAQGAIVVHAGGSVAPSAVLRPLIDVVTRTRRAVLVDDVTSHELLRRDRDRGMRVGSALCAPLMQGGAIVGVIQLENRVATGVFTDRQLVVVETICGQAAVSLHNARLFEEQRAMAESFLRFVPRPFLEQLGRSGISDVRLGDAVRADVTVSFSDLRGFTRVSEGTSAAESFKLLNDYLGRMEPAISRHGGFIDKYVGDAVMSLFINAPDGAVAAAVDMHRALREFNATRPGAEPLRMGLGLHAGEAMLGTVGSADRLDTTVIGDTVNTASRLEGASKDFFGAVLASGQVVARLQNPGPHLLREVGRITVKGKTEVLEVHEVLVARPPHEAEPAAAARELFADGLAAWYRADFGTGAEAFRAAAAAAPDDGLARSYFQRCERYLAAPPVGPWLGVEVMQHK